MKNLFLTAALAVVPAVYAQDPTLYECVYQYDVNGTTEKGDLSDTFNCILLIGEDSSKFLDYAAFQLDSVSAIKGISDDVLKEYEARDQKAVPYFDRRLFNSLSDNKLTTISVMAPFTYKYEEETPLIEWKLSDETQTVCGYECRKADGEYGGRKWTAWYAEEIPVPFGPWKMTGLPGLVMLATDSDGIHRFIAISFREGNGKISPDDIPSVIKTDHKKFEAQKAEYDKNPINSINPSDIESISILKGETNNIIVNGTLVRNFEKGSIPLEIVETKSDVKKNEHNNNSKDNITVVKTGSLKK